MIQTITTNIDNYEYFLDSRVVAYQFSGPVPPLKAGMDIDMKTLLGRRPGEVSHIEGKRIYVINSLKREIVESMACTETKMFFDNGVVYLGFIAQGCTVTADFVIDTQTLRINTPIAYTRYTCIGVDVEISMSTPPEETPEDTEVDISDLVLPRVGSEGYRPPNFVFPEEPEDDDKPKEP